ncbi:dTDP-glucose 4,6-dehydratase [Alishewanella longhuensis]|uniref:dTDP-glucose 4,6-dehydratase n=1 Tax=Alishewanella longhuensis TaxID=1091037 RepID=A0ABQ3KZ07_9ALTE|nr:dTDP-glucose 4,6-dehydratase [Alishewanella longhuensis]GHG67938.1 dTDP-glucose 4,6-dehydratase [Alishewanella longhuensis]
MKLFLVTGGSGFIGSAFVKLLLDRGFRVVNLDKLSYAANVIAENFCNNQGYTFIQGNINDIALLDTVINKYKPDYLVNLAAETHVDNSISNVADFVDSNVVGTCTLLTVALKYWRELPAKKAATFKFLQVSTDEVFGQLLGDAPAFTELSSYKPRNPYAASKAAADHFVRAWHNTYGFPAVISNCSNNYGPGQHIEKFIPKIITNALQGLSIPVYGNGSQSRDWLYVADHAKALLEISLNGEIGETYLIGGGTELTNLTLATLLCEMTADIQASSNMAVKARKELIIFVQDRPGHDQRYAIDSTKIRQELGWLPQTDFGKGLRSTVMWYFQQLNAGKLPAQLAVDLGK